MRDTRRTRTILYYWNGETQEEIATTLSIPLGTVKSRLHAAVATFSKRWMDKHGSDGNGGNGGDLGRPGNDHGTDQGTGRKRS